MLFVKPCVLGCCTKHEEHPHQEFNAIAPEEDGQAVARPSLGKDAEDGKADIRTYEELLERDASQEHHSFGELMIHQMIETIEFVLGTVSNTASYLRLWALSLAHSQLAAVFLENLLILAWLPNKETGVPPSSTSIIIMSWLLWYVFMSATFGILMCMDVLECFLHTLRLHWVEFQNKFYKGGGYLYNPFSFTAVFETEKNRP